MTIDPKEALRALDDIQTAKEKSSALRGYASAGSYLIVWGCVWIVGGAASFVSAEAGRWGWTISVLAGVVASVVLGLRAQRLQNAGKGVMGKVLATMATLAATSAALSLVLDVDSMREGTALQSVLVAAAYMAFGIWRGARIFVLGLALGVAVLFAWFYLGDRLEMFIGVAGGAMLIVSGLWLRKA